MQETARYISIEFTYWVSLTWILWKPDDITSKRGIANLGSDFHEFILVVPDKAVAGVSKKG